MWLTCKRAYIMQDYSNIRKPFYERISVGKKYKVLNQYTRYDGVRYWLFEIPQPEIKENPIGSGSFDIDEYFVTPEEERDLRIQEILNDTTN